MAKHRRQMPTLASLSKRQWLKILAGFASVGMLMGVGFVSRTFYMANHENSQITAYSATDADALEVSRGQDREHLRGASSGTRSVKLRINGKSRMVFGTKFTDVKSVLDAGDITLDPEDTVKPSLKTRVKESTVIDIQRADADLDTKQKSIPFNTVRKETLSLPKGQEKVETEGSNGVMEATSLVKRSGNKIVSSNILAAFVKTAPVDKVILVGTGAGTKVSSEDANIGITTPVGEKQQWAHDYLLSHGYNESDFTATVFIISHESGWVVNAQNPSGAYGLPQALPGSKMASAGADWKTNYQTQLAWFWGYCAQRYGSIQKAYKYWKSHRNY